VSEQSVKLLQIIALPQSYWMDVETCVCQIFIFWTEYFWCLGTLCAVSHCALYRRGLDSDYL